MTIYIVGIVFFVLVIIGSIFFFIYLKKDENSIAEISNSVLVKYNKTYKKRDFEQTVFSIYSNIMLNVNYQDYNFLKDAVSDEIYNKILMDIKTSKDKKEQNIVDKIEKNFCKLVDFDVVGDVEVAKFWIKYTALEYTTTLRNKLTEDGRTILLEEVIKGSKERPKTNEFLITFVKNYANNENIVCAECGNNIDILTSSICSRCGAEILSKKMHWVYTGRREFNSNK